MTVAEQRARKALRAHLTPAQAQEWRRVRRDDREIGAHARFRRLTVHGKRRRYFLFKVWHPGLRVYPAYTLLARNRSRDNRPRLKFKDLEFACLQVGRTQTDRIGRWPLDDQILAVKLALEANERWVVETANWDE